MENQQQCPHCLKYFKRLKTHKCKFLEVPSTTHSTSEFLKTSDLGSILKEFCKENEKTMELSRQRDQKLIEMMDSMNKQRIMEVQEILDLGEKRLNQEKEEKEKDRMHQKKLADQFCANTQEWKKKEVRAHEKFFQKRWKLEREINSTFTRISVVEPEYHSKLEMSVYGNRASPSFKKIDVKNYFHEHIFPSLCDQDMQNNCQQVVNDYKNLSNSYDQQLDFMASSHTLKEATEEIVDEFIEMEVLDLALKEMSNVKYKKKKDEKEKPLFSPNQFQDSLSSFCRPFPFFPFHNGIHKHTTEQFQAECDTIDSNFKKFQLTHKVENVLTPEVDKISETVKLGKTLIHQDGDQVVGSGQETPSSFKRMKQKEEENKQTLKLFFELWLGHKDFLTRPDIKQDTLIQNLGKLKKNIQKGIGNLRSFLMTVKIQLSSRTGYLPLFLEQNFQDQKFKKVQEELPADKRCDPNGRNLHMVEINQLLCSTCQQKLDQKSFSNGHLNPRKGGRMGTDFSYNIQPQCIQCNRQLGNIHMMLHPNYTPTALLS